MAAVSPSADQTSDLMTNLSLDSQTKTCDAVEVTRKALLVHHGSVNGGDAPNTSIPSRELSLTPLIQDTDYMVDPNICYLPHGYPSTACYYGDYNGSINGRDDYAKYAGQDAAAAYGDIYHHVYGYAPYGPYPSGSPVPTIGHDSQLYGSQHYQYPTQYYQPPTPVADPYRTNRAPTLQGELFTSAAAAAANQQPHSVDTVQATSNGTAEWNTNGISRSAPLKSSHQYPPLSSTGAYGRAFMQGGLSSSGYQDPSYGFDGIRSPVPWFDGTLFSTRQHRSATTRSPSSILSHNSSTPSARNQNQHPLPHLMGLHPPRPTSERVPEAPGFRNTVYPNNQMYGQLGNNTLRTGLIFGSNSYDSRSNGRWSLVLDSKYKPSGRGNGFYAYGSDNLDGFTELNRGPRADRFKNPKAFGPNVTIAVKGRNLASVGKEDPRVVIPDGEQYSCVEFLEKYSDAKFFIIKSYSEDDIHKSIKYSVWTSTPNGNKKLDAAYQEAQQKAGGCPVFLFFSVNTSGQFVGAAEMAGPVDFNRTLEYWQQDKWFGCFPVKWHILKDVPNNILKHIILENNENKPVTNSRDTQEVKLEQGLEMLMLFKDHVNKTSILDDFGFYETRQKMMQEKRAKQQSQKQSWDDAVHEDDREGTNGKPRLHKLLESVSLLNKDTAHSSLGERKPSEDNGVGLSIGISCTHQ